MAWRAKVGLGEQPHLVEEGDEADFGVGPRKVTDRQWLYLLDAVAGDKEFQGSFSGPLGRGRFGKKWEALAAELNKLGPVRKNALAWHTAYVALRGRARTGLAMKTAHLEGTGGGPPLEYSVEDCEKMKINKVYIRCLEVHGSVAAIGHRSVPNALQLQFGREASARSQGQQHSQNQHNTSARNQGLQHSQNQHNTSARNQGLQQFHNINARNQEQQNLQPDFGNVEQSGIRNPQRQMSPHVQRPQQSPRFSQHQSPHFSQHQSPHFSQHQSPHFSQHRSPRFSPYSRQPRSTNSEVPPNDSIRGIIGSSPSATPTSRKKLFDNSDAASAIGAVDMLSRAVKQLLTAIVELKLAITENTDAVRILDGHIYNHVVE